MTKLQLLHRALNERLMAAVEQIMEMVGGTVLEYEVETVRARKENEELRRRLRWMEGEVPTDWPEIEIDTSGSGQPVIVVDELVQNCPSIEIEPIDVSDLQSLIPDASLAAAVSIRSADLEIIPPGTTEAINSGISNSMGWASSLSYMAPLDSDPTVVKCRKGRSRSKRMSYACLHCGKVFEKEQRLILHMRTHSAERPYACRSRKACFYGEKKRKKKHGLSNGYPSRTSVEDNTAESTGPATVSNPLAAACSSLKAEPEKASKRSEIGVVKPVGIRRRRRRRRRCMPAFTEDNMSQCLECKRVFKKPSNLAMHMRIHRRPLSLEHPETKENIKKTDSGKARLRSLRKLFKCPHCDKVFTRKEWLAPHIQSHKNTTIIPQIKDLNKRKRITIPQLPKEEEKQTEPSNVRTDDSETAPELPEAKIEEASKINLELKSGSKSRGRKKRSRKRIPGKSTEDTGAIQKPKETFPCRVCGKLYVMAGCLITHERTHIAESLKKKEKREHMKMKRLREKQAKLQEQNLAEKVMEKKLDEMQSSINNGETENQDTGAGPSELSMEKSSDVQAVVSREPIGRKKFKCSHCYKSYNRRNWLELHMVCHDKLPFCLEDKLKDEIQKNGDEQTPQEGSPIEFSAIQNVNDGGKPSYTCPFCGNDFRHRTQLTVHMQSHICEKRYSCRQRTKLFYGERKRQRVPDSSIQKPVIKRSERNGAFVVTRSQVTLSQDHTSPSESMESIEPQSVCSEGNFSLLPQPSSSATSSCIPNQARTGLKLNSGVTDYFRLQPRIVLQPVCIKSKICTLPEERDLKSVQTDRSARVSMSSSRSDPEPVGVAFSDVDSSDDNDWSDVLHSLDEDLAQQQTAPKKLADVETVDIFHPSSSEKPIDAASDEEFIPKRAEEHGAHDDLANRDDLVATSIQVTGKHSSSTCMICGLKFASNASLSQHMRIHSSFSSGSTGRSVNFRASCNTVVNSETKVKQQVGQEQTPELQEVSTNFPEIKEKMDFATVVEEKTPQSSGHYPDIDDSTRSKEGSETPSKSRKPNEESMERKYLRCCFCGKACKTIELHLKFDHPREPEVMDALRRGKNSKERKRLLSGLCSSKSSGSDKRDAALNEGLVHCLFCQGSYRRNQFWKHALVCEQKKAEERSTVSDAAHSVCTTKPSPENRQSEAQKGEITDATFDTAQDTLPEELTNPSAVQTIADPHKGDSSSDASSADVQKTDLTTANPIIHVSGSSKNIVPDLKSGCSPVQDGDSSETPEPSDPETSHVKEEMGKNDEDTGNTGSELCLKPDSDCTTVLKRKLDSQDSEFTEAKARKMMQSDPSQPERVDNNLSDEAEAASPSTKTHNCPHCSSTFCSPHQCMCLGDTPPSLDQNLAKKQGTLDKEECCTTTSAETSIPTEENAFTSRD